MENFPKHYIKHSFAIIGEIKKLATCVHLNEAKRVQIDIHVTHLALWVRKLREHGCIDPINDIEICGCDKKLDFIIGRIIHYKLMTLSRTENKVDITLKSDLSGEFNIRILDLLSAFETALSTNEYGITE